LLALAGFELFHLENGQYLYASQYLNKGAMVHIPHFKNTVTKTSSSIIY
jgi:hypothetical protein